MNFVSLASSIYEGKHTQFTNSEGDFRVQMRYLDLKRFQNNETTAIPVAFKIFRNNRCLSALLSYLRIRRNAFYAAVLAACLCSTSHFLKFWQKRALRISWHSLRINFCTAGSIIFTDFPLDSAVSTEPPHMLVIGCKS